MTMDAQQKLEHLEKAFGALAHPTRRHILLAIQFRDGAMTAGDIAARFSCKWPTVTRHLKVLVEAGLLTTQKDGRNRLYRINYDRLELAKDWLGWLSPKE